MQVVSKKIIINSYKNLLSRINKDSVDNNLGPENYFVEYLKMMRDVIDSKRDKTVNEIEVLSSINYALNEKKLFDTSLVQKHRDAFYDTVSANLDRWINTYASI